MNQSGLFNSFVCHLDSLSYLVKLYLNSFASSLTLCREEQVRTAVQTICPRQRGNSLAFFPVPYDVQPEVSGVNCGTIKAVSLLSKLQNILQYANKMWLIAYSHLVNGWLLVSDTFACDKHETMREIQRNVAYVVLPHILWVQKMDLNDAMSIVTVIFNFQ